MEKNIDKILDEFQSKNNKERKVDLRQKIVEEIRRMTVEERMEFIRERLTINGERLRFNMSGYDFGFDGGHIEGVGECMKHNQMVLNQFAFTGIYDVYESIFIHFYQGSVIICFGGIFEDEKMNIEYATGYGTREIIDRIFQLTILSNRSWIRRDN